ncbi:hypothetical protein QN277_002132 [Acacia crassicarpa]|uniref:Uncharacterized protein n=1 Tax=Acacia crassicarpa TaxID=499986 RepID=A0AAE1NB28_9FABA|nr:hypothetical protein QN277_002132 [Acacia crassicarpa]
MGKWRNRRFFRQRRSPRPPPPVFYDLQAPLPDFRQDGVPLWEKKFCTLIGLVPWQKIVDTKNLMSCHTNVLNWNDSAAEEAFQNAKRLYWAKINSLPCDISFPDSDTYIDKIDWNPYLDPELMKDINRAYFCPPDEEESNDVGYKRRKVSANIENSQECDSTEHDKASENEVLGWNQCEPSKHKNSPSNSEKNANNPWEHSVTHENRGSTDNGWEGGCAKIWGWNQVSGHSDHLKDRDCRYNPWQNDNKGWGKAWDDNKEWGKAWDGNKGWGKAWDGNKGWGQAWDNSWNRKQSNNSSNNERPWECKSNPHNRAPTGRGWRNCEGNSTGWKQQRNIDNVSGDLQFRRQCGDWTARNQSFQNRGSYHQPTVGSRFQRDSHQTDHSWRRENSKKRISFACE